MRPNLHKDQKRFQAKKKMAEKKIKDKQTGFLEALRAGWEADYGGDLQANPRSVAGALLGTTGRYAYEPIEAFERLVGAMDKARKGRLEDVDVVQEVTGPLTEIGMLSSVAGRAPSPGSLRTFAGRSAKKADTEALQRAQRLQEAGMPQKDIWQDTGWIKGKDDRWRFEISDANAQFKPENLEGSGEIYEGRLGDVLDHPELFEAYPDLKQVSIGTSYKDSSSFSPGMDHISLKRDVGEALKSYKKGDYREALEQELSYLKNKDLEATGKSNYEEAPHLFDSVEDAIREERQMVTGRIQELEATLSGDPKPQELQDAFERELLHETQHAIQKREDFSRGSSPEQSKVLDELTQLQFQEAIDVANIANQKGISYKKAFQQSDITANNEEMLKNIIDQGRFEKMVDYARKALRSPREQYMRTPGEVEARNVERRRTWSDEYRSKTSPAKSADYPEELYY